MALSPLDPSVFTRDIFLPLQCDQVFQAETRQSVKLDIQPDGFDLGKHSVGSQGSKRRPSSLPARKASRAPPPEPVVTDPIIPPKPSKDAKKQYGVQVRKKPSGPSLVSYFLFHTCELFNGRGNYWKTHASELIRHLKNVFGDEVQPGSEKHRDVVLKWLDNRRDFILNNAVRQPRDLMVSYLIKDLIHTYKKKKDSSSWQKVTLAQRTQAVVSTPTKPPKPVSTRNNSADVVPSSPEIPSPTAKELQTRRRRSHGPSQSGPALEHIQTTRARPRRARATRGKGKGRQGPGKGRHPLTRARRAPETLPPDNTPKWNSTT